MGRKNNMKNSNPKGYTLLEVMVALVIIGVSITAVTGALSAAADLSVKADRAVDSVRIMKNILNNPEMIRAIAENKSFEDKLDDEEGWVCRAEVTALEINSNDIDVYVEGEDWKDSASNDKGEDIEIAGILLAKICLSNTRADSEKSYCIERWIKEM